MAPTFSIGEHREAWFGVIFCYRARKDGRVWLGYSDDENKEM